MRSVHLPIRLVRVFEVLARHPDRRIGDIDLLDSEERRRILTGWNATAHPLPETTLPLLFERQVERTPDAVALVFEDAALSYAQLNARANRLAHHLIAQGIGPEDIVGIALPRSADMVVGLLAVLKSGAAYLPLDPDYPADRLALMIEDAGPRRILTTHDIEARVTGTAPLILLDDVEMAPVFAASRNHNPTIEPCSAADHPASVLRHHHTLRFYRTAENDHCPHNLTSSIIARLRYYGSPGSIVLLPSIAFDSSVATFFWALCSGASLVLPAAGANRDPQQLAGWWHAASGAHLVERSFPLRGHTGVGRAIPRVPPHRGRCRRALPPGTIERSRRLQPGARFVQ